MQIISTLRSPPWDRNSGRWQSSAKGVLVCIGVCSTGACLPSQRISWQHIGKTEKTRSVKNSGPVVLQVPVSQSPARV
jgi:hypothetical protein